MRYVIIGSGVSGVAAIEAIRSLDKTGEIVMIGDDPHGFYSRPGLAYYLTGELHDKALFPRTADDYRRMNFRYLKGRVTRIARESRCLQLDGGASLSYDRLLIAVGAQATPLESPGADLEGVLKLDHLEDAKRILKHARLEAYKAKKGVAASGKLLLKVEVTGGKVNKVDEVAPDTTVADKELKTCIFDAVKKFKFPLAKDAKGNDDEKATSVITYPMEFQNK